MNVLKRAVATTVALALTCQQAVWGMPDQMPLSERDQAPPEKITTNITADRTNPLTQKTQNFVIVQTLANAARLEADHSQTDEERKKLLVFAKVLDAAAFEMFEEFGADYEEMMAAIQKYALLHYLVRLFEWERDHGDKNRADFYINMFSETYRIIPLEIWEEHRRLHDRFGHLPEFREFDQRIDLHLKILTLSERDDIGNYESLIKEVPAGPFKILLESSWSFIQEEREKRRNIEAEFGTGDFDVNRYLRGVLEVSDEDEYYFSVIDKNYPSLKHIVYTEIGKGLHTLQAEEFEWLSPRFGSDRKPSLRYTDLGIKGGAPSTAVTREDLKGITEAYLKTKSRVEEKQERETWQRYGSTTHPFKRGEDFWSKYLGSVPTVFLPSFTLNKDFIEFTQTVGRYGLIAGIVAADLAALYFLGPYSAVAVLGIAAMFATAPNLNHLFFNNPPPQTDWHARFLTNVMVMLPVAALFSGAMAIWPRATTAIGLGLMGRQTTLHMMNDEYFESILAGLLTLGLVANASRVFSARQQTEVNRQNTIRFLPETETRGSQNVTLFQGKPDHPSADSYYNTSRSPFLGDPSTINGGRASGFLALRARNDGALRGARNDGFDPISPLPDPEPTPIFLRNPVRQSFSAITPQTQTLLQPPKAPPQLNIAADEEPIRLPWKEEIPEIPNQKEILFGIALNSKAPFLEEFKFSANPLERISLPDNYVVIVVKDPDTDHVIQICVTSKGSRLYQQALQNPSRYRIYGDTSPQYNERTVLDSADGGTTSSPQQNSQTTDAEIPRSARDDKVARDDKEEEIAARLRILFHGNAPNEDKLKGLEEAKELERELAIALFMQALIENQGSMIAEEAAKALGKIGGDNVIFTLETLANNDDNPRLQQAAFAGLEAAATDWQKDPYLLKTQKILGQDELEPETSFNKKHIFEIKRPFFDLEITVLISNQKTEFRFRLTPHHGDGTERDIEKKGAISLPFPSDIIRLGDSLLIKPGHSSRDLLFVNIILYGAMLRSLMPGEDASPLPFCFVPVPHLPRLGHLVPSADGNSVNLVYREGPRNLTKNITSQQLDAIAAFQMQLFSHLPALSHRTFSHAWKEELARLSANVEYQTGIRGLAEVMRRLTQSMVEDKENRTVNDIRAEMATVMSDTQRTIQTVFTPKPGESGPSDLREIWAFALDPYLGYIPKDQELTDKELWMLISKDPWALKRIHQFLENKRQETAIAKDDYLSSQIDHALTTGDATIIPLVRDDLIKGEDRLLSGIYPNALRELDRLIRPRAADNTEWDEILQRRGTAFYAELLNLQEQIKAYTEGRIERIRSRIDPFGLLSQKRHYEGAVHPNGITAKCHEGRVELFSGKTLIHTFQIEARSIVQTGEFLILIPPESATGRERLLRVIDLKTYADASRIPIFYLPLPFDPDRFRLISAIGNEDSVAFLTDSSQDGKLRKFFNVAHSMIADVALAQRELFNVLSVFAEAKLGRGPVLDQVLELARHNIREVSLNEFMRDPELENRVKELETLIDKGVDSLIDFKPEGSLPGSNPFIKLQSDMTEAMTDVTRAYQKNQKIMTRLKLLLQTLHDHKPLAGRGLAAALLMSVAGAATAHAASPETTQAALDSVAGLSYAIGEHLSYWFSRTGSLLSGVSDAMTAFTDLERLNDTYGNYRTAVLATYWATSLVGSFSAVQLIFQLNDFRKSLGTAEFKTFQGKWMEENHITEITPKVRRTLLKNYFLERQRQIAVEDGAVPAHRKELIGMKQALFRLVFSWYAVKVTMGSTAQVWNWYFWFRNAVTAPVRSLLKFFFPEFSKVARKGAMPRLSNGGFRVTFWPGKRGAAKTSSIQEALFEDELLIRRKAAEAALQETRTFIDNALDRARLATAQTQEALRADEIKVLAKELTPRARAFMRVATNGVVYECLGRSVMFHEGNSSSPSPLSEAQIDQWIAEILPEALNAAERYVHSNRLARLFTETGRHDLSARFSEWIVSRLTGAGLQEGRYNEVKNALKDDPRAVERAGLKVLSELKVDKPQDLLFLFILYAGAQGEMKPIQEDFFGPTSVFYGSRMLFGYGFGVDLIYSTFAAAWGKILEDRNLGASEKKFNTRYDARPDNPETSFARWWLIRTFMNPENSLGANYWRYWSIITANLRAAIFSMGFFQILFLGRIDVDLLAWGYLWAYILGGLDMHMDQGFERATGWAYGGFTDEQLQDPQVQRIVRQRMQRLRNRFNFVFNFYKNIRGIAMLLFATLPAEDPATGETVNRAGIRHFFGGTTPTVWLDERLSNIGAEHPHLQSACDALRQIITNNHPDFVEPPSGD